MESLSASFHGSEGIGQRLRIPRIARALAAVGDVSFLRTAELAPWPLFTVTTASNAAVSIGSFEPAAGCRAACRCGEGNSYRCDFCGEDLGIEESAGDDLLLAKLQSYSWVCQPIPLGMDGVAGVRTQ